MIFESDLTVADYTVSGSPNVDQVAYLFRPAGVGPYPLLIDVPEVGVVVGPTLSEADGLPFLARAEGLAVLRLGYTQPARGVFDGQDDHDYPARDVRWIVQRARQAVASWRIDPNRIVIHGVGLGARAAALTAFGPDLADPLGGSQEQQSTRVAAAILERPVALWSAHVQATTKAYPDFSADKVAALSTIDPGVQDLNSPLLLVDDPRNLAMRFAGVHQGVAESSATGAPYPSDELEDIATGWSSEVLRARLDLQGVQRYYSRTWDTTIPGNETERSEQAVLSWLLWVVGRLPVEELVLRALEEQLRTITTANGYGLDVLRVERHENLGSFRVYPSVVVVALGADFDNSLFSTKSHNHLRLGLSLINAGTQRWQERASIFLAAVRRALDDNPALVDRPIGTGAAMSVHIREARRFVDELGGRERSGVVCECLVTWRDALGDPYTELG